MQPKASAILSVYNGEKTLPEVLNSLLGQTYQNLEIIVVDDGSTDNSREILKKYARHANNITVLENPTNLGISKSLNKAIARAQGTYIVRSDADDISLSERVEEQVRVLEESPELGCVSCYVDPLVSLEELENWQQHPFESQRRSLSTPQDLARHLPHHNVFHGGEVVYRKSLWEEVGGYRTEFIVAEDYDLWLRMVKHTQFYIVPQVLYVRRFYSSSSSASHRTLLDFLFELAQRGYYTRHQGLDDQELVRTEVVNFMSNTPAYAHFLQRL